MTTVQVWRSENNLTELVLSFHHVGLWSQLGLSDLTASPLPAESSRGLIFYLC